VAGREQEGENKGGFVSELRCLLGRRCAAVATAKRKQTKKKEKIEK
jgi:hypothetical protein